MTLPKSILSRTLYTDLQWNTRDIHMYHMRGHLLKKLTVVSSLGMFPKLRQKLLYWNIVLAGKIIDYLMLDAPIAMPHSNDVVLDIYEVTMIGITKTPVACYTVPAKSSTAAVEIAMAIHHGPCVINTTATLLRKGVLNDS